MAKKRIVTFLAPSKGLSIAGSHCYAYSGDISAKNTTQTVLDFHGTSGYIVASLTLTAPIRMDASNIGGGFIRGYQLDFNGQTVGMYKADSQQEDMPQMLEASILIPPLTHVVLTCVDHATDATSFGTANLTGRVYDA